MCDFLNDYYDETFPVVSCSPNGEYYKFSNQARHQGYTSQAPQNLLMSKDDNVDTYNIVRSVQPQTIAVNDKIQIDRHDILIILMFIIIIIVIKMLISIYNLNKQFKMYTMYHRQEPQYIPQKSQEKQPEEQPIKKTLDEKVIDNIGNIEASALG